MIQTPLIQEPFEAYRQASKDYLTSHRLSDFRKCPLLYWKKKQGLIPDGDTQAFALGRAAHTLILEGREVFDQRFCIGGPVNPKTGQPFGPNTKAYAEWEAKMGKKGISDEDYDLIHSLRAAVHAHPVAAQLLAEGMAEGVARGDYHETACQIRMDWLHPERGIVDLKTCDDLTWFESDARRFSYLHQLAFYRAVLAALTGHCVPVHIIAVEKKEPYRAGVWRLDDQALGSAQKENEAAMVRLKRCLASNTWPSGYEDVRFFTAN